MTKHKTGDQADQDKLRQKALDKIKKENLAFDTLTLNQAKEIAHELNVHQIELAMQNEHLKNAYIKMEALRDKYEALFDNAPVGYLSSTVDGIIIDANTTIAQMLNTSIITLRDKSLASCFEDKDSIYLHIRTMGHAVGKMQCRNYFQTKKGEKRFVLLESIVIRNEKSGNPNELLTTVMDITEQVQLEQKLRHSQRLESIGTLAGGIAHEFNNLLTIIIGNIELAAEEDFCSSDIRDNLEEIQIAGLRARDVVKQLLLFSRQDTTQQKVMNIGLTIKDSLKLIRSSIPEHITIDAKIPDDLNLIVGNSTQINQMLINLCGNAAYAMGGNAGSIFIKLSNETLTEKSNLFPHKTIEKEYINLTIRDTGCGIPENVQEKIFEPYFTTKEIGKGTGIGLSVVHGIVKSHMGQIKVESQLNKGTTFTIHLPVSMDKLPETNVKENRFPTGTEHILFIDDEESIFKLVVRQLERLGYKVTGTKDPRQAIEWFKATPRDFDLLITDLAMPIMTGDKVAMEILEIRPEMPILLCTGNSSQILNGAIEFSGIITKPFDLKTLAETIRTVLD